MDKEKDLLQDAVHEGDWDSVGRDGVRVGVPVAVRVVAEHEKVPVGLWLGGVSVGGEGVRVGVNVGLKEFVRVRGVAVTDVLSEKL